MAQATRQTPSDALSRIKDQDAPGLPLQTLPSFEDECHAKQLEAIQDVARVYNVQHMMGSIIAYVCPTVRLPPPLSRDGLRPPWQQPPYASSRHCARRIRRPINGSGELSKHPKVGFRRRFSLTL